MNSPGWEPVGFDMFGFSSLMTGQTRQALGLQAPTRQPQEGFAHRKFPDVCPVISRLPGAL